MPFRASAIILISFGLIRMGHAATVVLHSGNGGGATDTLVTFELGPGGGTFPLFTGADFAAAVSGPAASIITPNPAWHASLAADPAALWIGTNPSAASNGNTALYAISFNLPFNVSSANLDLFYSVDDTLGTGANQGAYLNGSAVAPSGGDFFAQHSVSNPAVGPLLHAGTNTLFINATNGSGPAGLIFSATITTQDIIPTGGAPEPSSALLIVSAAALGVWRRRRKEHYASRA
jgi:hypothetical protein